MNFGYLLQGLGILTMCAFLSSCAVNPATGTPDLVFMSEKEEIETGREMHEKLMKSMPIYQDEKLAEYINTVGQKIVKNSHRPDISYQFHIIDAPDINAFALPGGYIYINRGLLAYLNSEAQLAAVLAHEIAHVTARHVVRQDAARTGATTLSILSVLATGQAALGDATSLWGTAAVKGYGREMELEADGLAAEYLFKTGYDPQAIVETIGVLKDQEKFTRYRAKSEGKRPVSYHGVFSTHPRNDVRLKEVIAKAGILPKTEGAEVLEQPYREHIQGMVYGVNYEAMMKEKPVEEGRYIHRKLGFSIKFPKDWEVENQRSAIVGSAKDKSANMTLQIGLNRQRVPPDEYLRGAIGENLLLRSEDFAQNGLIGHTGIISGDKNNQEQRVAVLFQGTRAYVIKGKVIKPTQGVDYDAMFLKSIKTFRPERNIRRPKKSMTIHYVKANENTDIDELAKQINLGAYTPQQLRLLNGLYPRGEPKPGDWIKIIQ